MKKTIFSLIIGLVLIVAMAGLVTAVTITYDNPASGGTLTASGIGNEGTVNITTASQLNVTNCTLIFSASNTNATTPFTVLVNSTTDNATDWQFRFNANTVEDTSNGLLNVSCQEFNKSANAPVSATRAVIMDSSAPTAATSVTPTANQILTTSNTVVFKGTLVAADSTGCYVQFFGSNPGKAVYSTQNLSATATSCSITVKNVPEGTYKYSYYGTDDLNNTPIAKRTFNLDLPTGAGKSVYYQQQVAEGEQVTTDQSQKTLVAIIVAIVVITMIMKKGGSRRK